MAEKFDPYYKWLGIPPKDQPPSHYRLLGLEVFESDAEVIDRAANRLMDYLHSITDGEHLAQSQALLNEIAAARLCLLDQKQKTAYDEGLRAESAHKGQDGDADESGERAARTVRGKRSRAATPPPAPVEAPPLAPPPVQRHAEAGRPQRPAAKKPPLALLIGLGAGVLVLISASVFMLMSQSGPTKVAKQGPTTSPTTGSSVPREGKTFDSSPPPDWFKSPPDGAGNGEGAKTSEPTKTEPGKTNDPAKTDDPPMPPGKEPPQADTAKLLEWAVEAIKKRNTQEAIDLLEKYVSDPTTPERAKAHKWQVFLQDIAKDEVVIGQLRALTNAQLLEIEAGRLIVRASVEPELMTEVFMDAVRRSMPAIKRQRGMLADAGKPKEKIPPDPKAATGDPKTADPKTPAKTPDPPQPVPDPLAKPAEFLASQGLAKRGTLWHLNEDPAINAMSGLADLEKKYTAAAGKVTEGLKALTRTRTQLSTFQQQYDQAQSQGRQSPPQVVQFINEWRPKIGDNAALGNYAELRTLLMSRIAPRNDLLAAVLKAHKALDPLDDKYKQLADDSRVVEALSKLPGEKVAPSTKLGPARTRFGKTAALVLTDETPLYLQGRETLLSVVVGDTPTELAYLPAQNFHMITEALVKKLGLAVPANAPRVSISRTVAGKVSVIPCREISIAGIRLGKHVLKELRFLVTGPEGVELGSGFGAQAFDGYRIETDYDNFVFKIRSQDAPDPKPGKK